MTSNGEGPISWAQSSPINPRSLKTLSKVALIIASVVALAAIFVLVNSIYVEWLWFDSLGYLGIYQKILGLRILLFFAGFLLFAILALISLHFAYRFSKGEYNLPIPPEAYKWVKVALIGVVSLVVFVMSLIFGLITQSKWEIFLTYFNRVPFGINDPQFDRDMSFYVAVLPVLNFIQGWLLGAFIAIAVASLVLCLAVFLLRGTGFSFTPAIRKHLAIIFAFLMIIIAFAHFLDIFELVLSDGGVAPGAGYTDIHARMPTLWILFSIALLSAGGFFASLYYGGTRLMVASFSLWVVIAIVAGNLYPALIERTRVKPNQFVREEPYIERAISSTRAAYGLDNIEEKAFNYSPSLDVEKVTNNLETINNVRLWDHRPLRDTYGQIQTFRQYYNFVGVDVDRYRFSNGDFRQVMLSARELFPEQLEGDAQNWVNRKLSYTHGFGVAMSPVNRATVEGRPEFFLKDLPPQGNLTVSRPEIYYGENTTGFVIVNTNTDEFNYPKPEGAPVYSRYDGDGGIGIGSFNRRLAFAVRFLDFNLLISGQINSESRIQFNREIKDRVGRIAPFLQLDSDPYLVVEDNKGLWWIQDAYVSTNRYAYSDVTKGNDGQPDFNYIRNSVKVIVNAYDGSVFFFAIDPSEPLTQIYMKAFPQLFINSDDVDKMSPILRDHIRYPEDLFFAQSNIYLRYHMTDPQQFFAREDLWGIPREVISTPTNTQDVEPYYVIMKLPGEDEEEFVLLLPFTPGGVERKNIVAWLAARNDGDHYGKLVAFIFPKDRQVDGPEQIEGRITSDETIGRELSLLCPEGKLCIRGNLLAIPMEDTLLYVEPLYVRAEALALPLLKKVILADSENVVMADTLAESLDLLLGGAAPSLVESVAKETDPGDKSGISPIDLNSIRDAINILRTDVDELEQIFDKVLDKIEDYSK